MTANPVDGRLSLTLVAPSEDAVVAEILFSLEQGVRSVRIGPGGDPAEAVVARLASAGATFRLHVEGGKSPPPAGLTPLPADEAADLVVRLETDGEALSAALMGLLDLPRGRVIAAHTDRSGLSLPLFLVSIPKSGTHLLMELARALGYRNGEAPDGGFESGTWYYLEYSNSHTAAPDFFIDTVRRSPFGNRQHPFPVSPTLFIYRHPLDILVSEASYYHRPGKTVFSGYLSHLSFEERLLRLVDDPWLMGSLRDRVGKFAAWLDFGSVIPLAFEELVGAAGASDPALQRRALWSVLLKLQVAGDVDTVAASIFNPHSATFEKGTIGRHRESMTPAAWQAVGRLNPDFMAVFGYDQGREGSPMPRRAEEFRHRPLLLEKSGDQGQPVLIEQNFLGWNLVRFRGSYVGVPLDRGPFDLAAMPVAELASLPSGSSPAALRSRIASLKMEAEARTVLHREVVATIKQVLRAAVARRLSWRWWWDRLVRCPDRKG